MKLFRWLVFSVVCVAAARPLFAQSPVHDAAHRDWNFGPFAQGGVGIGDRSDYGFFAIGFHAAHTMTDDLGSGVLQGTAEYGIEAIPFWQSYTPKFPRIFCSAPTLCSAPYTVGGTFTGASVTPIILRYNFTHGHRLMPWVQAAGGVLFTTKKYPAVGSLNAADPTSTGPNADTSQINFIPQGGAGLHYFVRNKRSIDLGLNAAHISSASLGDKNPGVNASLQFTLGYSWWK